MAKHQDLTGMVFERLTVLREAGKKKPGVYLWECECSCDKHTHIIVEGANLRNGNTKSCGCIRREQLSTRNKNNAIHHVSNKNIFRVWEGMRDRCYNPNNKKYKDYGGRGIKICDKWLTYQNFELWAISTGYEKGLTIERIDFNKEYCPENCKWVTWKEQQNNKRNNKYLEYKGRTQTLAQWCEELKLDYSRTKARINACGWTVEEAFEREKYAQVNLGK